MRSMLVAMELSDVDADLFQMFCDVTTLASKPAYCEVNETGVQRDRYGCFRAKVGLASGRMRARSSWPALT